MLRRTSKMATLTLKNVPAELYERLKERSRAHRRSINSEAIWCLERELENERVDPDSLLARAREVRDRVRGVYLSEGALREAKNRGRP
jgi:plasmid stability protein